LTGSGLGGDVVLAAVSVCTRDGGAVYH